MVQAAARWRVLQRARIGAAIAASLLATGFAGKNLARAQSGDPSASLQIVIDTANWVATDDLGRTLPTPAQAGPPKPARWVGLFYWQWHGPDRWGPDYNMTEFLKAHPGFKDFQAFPTGGPAHPTWYWAEPIFGYYSSRDPWVIRKQLVLFADAGVDFLFLDYTNGSIYDPELKTLLEVATELKAKGVRVPRLTFFLNSEPEWKIEALYREWYKPGKYDDLWFRWNGKPLLMAAQPTNATKLKNSALLPEIQTFFTYRQTWAFHDAAKEPTKWRFMDKHPQRPARGPDGKIEQIVVSKSLGGPIWDNMQTASASATPGHVPVYNAQWVSPDAPKGLFFQEQWRVANANPAPILLVTGWNEWTASVWETPGVVMLGRKTVKGQGHIVDEFNEDFNRDLEPMRGGYGDNYFYQFAANLRLYKGMRAAETASGERSIRIEGPLSQWQGVTPVFQDADGDTANRDADGVTPRAHYTNTTARNDIVIAQVARDSRNLYFHVQTAVPLTTPTGKSWMTLLIDADSSAATGWHGYDFLIDRSRSDGRTCSVERYDGGSGSSLWRWRKMADVPFHVSGRDLTIAIPRSVLGLGISANHPLQFDFKWADNLPESPEIEDFYTDGDVAPDARFNYRYTALLPSHLQPVARRRN